MARIPPLPSASTVQALKDWFGCYPSTAKLAAALFEAGGDYLSRDDLMALTGQTPDGLRTSIGLLRATMDPGSIRNDPSCGWCMTTTGLADCRAALDDAARRGLGEQVAA